jgi:hypothetical protein
MKGWQTACIPDERDFVTYSRGEEITIVLIAYREWVEDFQAGIIVANVSIF